MIEDKKLDEEALKGVTGGKVTFENDCNWLRSTAPKISSVRTIIKWYGIFLK